MGGEREGEGDLQQTRTKGPARHPLEQEVRLQFPHCPSWNVPEFLQ